MKAPSVISAKRVCRNTFKAVADTILGNGRRGFEFNVTNGWLGITDSIGRRRYCLTIGVSRLASSPNRAPEFVIKPIAGSARSRRHRQHQCGCSPAPRKASVNFPFAGHGNYNNSRLNHFDL